MIKYSRTIHDLIQKYFSQETLSTKEKLLLEAWVADSTHNAMVIKNLGDKSWVSENLFNLQNTNTEKIWPNLELLIQE